jgi:2'-hydroxyisoflavone reductase
MSDTKKHISRRQVLQAASALGAASLLALPTAKAAQPKRILVLGGTGFLGPAIVEAAQARGHTLTLFNRGKTRPGLFPNIEKRQGDRDPLKGEGLTSLETGEWDAVIDDSGYYPRMVAASAQLLAPRVKQYLYVSSISCYKEPSPVGGDEATPLAVLADPKVETMGKNFENYGGLKAACEQAAEKAMPGRTTVVRPGYIVGPDDPTGRFTYWPVRFAQGGEIAVPGAPTDPFQLIDVRDLAEWLVHAVETNTTGPFNAVGPAEPMNWGRTVAACQKSAGKPNAPTTLTWISSEFMSKQADIEFPIWSPYYGDTKGFHTWKNTRAVKAGMRFRPIEQTVADTLAWYQAQLKVEQVARTKLAFTPEQEAEILKRWKAAKAG